MVLHTLILKLMALPRDRMTFSYETLICKWGTSSVSLPLCKLGNTFVLDILDILSLLLHLYWEFTFHSQRLAPYRPNSAVLYSRTQPTCHHCVFLLCSFIWQKASLVRAGLENVPSAPVWLRAIFEVWYFMNNLDEKHSWEFQLTWNFVHLALVSAFCAWV